MMQTTEKRPAMRLTVSAAALAALLLLLAACGGKERTTAATMHLKRSQGTVSVSDGGGKDVPLLDNLGLYSGYGVDTRSDSYAWIALDNVKLTKMDQNSEITIRKIGKALDIKVESGSLFFNITEPLAEDETLNIRTSTMLVGIRGTCGWVGNSDGLSRVYLLEGKVNCLAGEQTVRVSAGEMAELTADGELTVKEFTAEDIPAFVRDEVGPELPDSPNETHGPGSPEGPEPSEMPEPVHQYPVQELSAEHKAFLDEVWAAMEASDLDALDVLSQNDMVREIVVDVIAPYARRLAEEYGELSYLTYGDHASDNDDNFYWEGGSYEVAYTGEVICVGNMRQQGLYIRSEERRAKSMTVGPMRQEYISFRLLLEDYGYAGGMLPLSSHKFYDFHSTQDFGYNQSSTIWVDQYLQYPDRFSMPVPVGEWTSVERHDYDYDQNYGDGYGSRQNEIQLRGEFQMEQGRDGIWWPCLENGQVTLSYSDDSDRSGCGTIDVADGYVVRQDDACSIVCENNGRWHIYLIVGNFNALIFTNDLTGEMQNGLPYHPFHTSGGWS